MSVVDLVILATAILCAASAGMLVRRVGEANRNLHRLLAFLDGAHVEHRRTLQDDQVITSAFRKTMTDDLRGCRNSIDAIRSATDELSVHRRDTVELGAAPERSHEAAQIAAGLARPRSARQEAPSTRPPTTDPPTRSQTRIGTTVPAAPRALPPVVPQPIARPRSPATLLSMGAVAPPGKPATPPVETEAHAPGKNISP